MAVPEVVPEAVSAQDRRANRFVGLLIVEQSLRGRDGHYFEYDRSVRQAALDRGLQSQILAHRRVEPEITAPGGVAGIFRHSFHDNLTGSTLTRLTLDPLLSNLCYYADLSKGMDRRVDSGWIVFVPTIDHRQLLAWVWWLLRRKPASAPTIVFLFRTTYLRGAGVGRWSHSAIWLKIAFRLLERLGRSRVIRMATDSGNLAREYGKMTSLPFEVLPIPHCVHPRLRDGSRRVGDRRPLRFISLGDARL